MRRLALAAAGAVVALCAPASALAHATLVRSEPGSRAVVGRSPGEVSLVFDDTIRRGPGIAAVRNGGGSVLGGHARATGKTLTIPLRQGLGDGDYTVRWSVFSDDGHLIQGILAFAVGKGRAPPGAALGVQRRGVVGVVVARWAYLLGLLAAGGLAIFRVAVWRVSQRAFAGALVLAAGGGGALLLVSGAGTSTRFGLAVAVAAGLAALGAILAAFGRREADWLALALLPIPSVAGHALDPGRPWYQLAADLAHVAAASVWLGGLVALVLGGVPAERRRRFSTLAVGAVIALTATGIARAYGELTAWHDLWGAGYGRAILVKSGLLLALVALGASNRRGLRRPIVLTEVAL
ncbi:MAG: copper resistance protein CopC, partial [Gaiellaceae bacterium]